MKNITEKQIINILKTAETMNVLVKKEGQKKAPHLQGKSIVLFFAEEDLRTRLSYELAGQFLSANIVNITENIKGDADVIEIGTMVERMGADFMVINHPVSGTANYLAKNVTSKVINAGDGINEDPSSALLDLMTIKRHKGGFDGLNVTFVGDMINSRRGKSNMWALLKLGANVTVSAPATLIPSGLEKLGVRIVVNPYDAVENADVIMVQKLLGWDNYKKLLPSENEYKTLYKVGTDMLHYAHKDVIVIHPGQVKRGVEVSSKITVANQMLMEEQVENGVAIRMALLYLLSIQGGDKL